MSDSKKQVPVRLGPAELKAFEDYAEAAGMAKQTILKRALDQFMRDHPVKRPKKRGA